MTKERFLWIAEEVGILSSDWREDLWEAHLRSSSGLSAKGEEEAARLTCTWAVEDGGTALDRLRRATRD